MIIRRVKLSKVFSHEDTETMFPDGVVSVVGPNGAGKSSIIDSIYLALFSDAKPDIRGGKKEFVVMRGRSRGEITVEFEVEGRRYLVVRRVDVTGSSEAFLYEVGAESRRLVAEGIPNVIREVGKVLGLPTYSARDLRKLVRATLLALQDELTQIIDVTDSERKEWVLSLLGLSYLERALEELRGYTKDVRKEVETRRSEKLMRLEELRRQIEKARAKLREVEVDLEKYEERAREVEGRVGVYRERIGITDSALDLCHQLRAGVVWRRISELEKRVELLEPVESWNPDTYSVLRRELERRELELESVEEELSKLLGELASRLSIPLGGFEDVNRIHRELSEDIRVLGEKIGGLRELAGIYSQMLSKLEIGETCPVCGSRIVDPGEVRERLRRTLNEIEEAYTALSAKLGELRRKLTLLEDAYTRISRLTSSRETLRRDVLKIREELEHLTRIATGICGRVGFSYRSVEECIDFLKSARSELRQGRAELEVLRRVVAGGAGPPAEPLEVISGRLSKVLSLLGLALPEVSSPESLDYLVNEVLKPMRRKLELELRSTEEELGGLRVRIGELRALLKSRSEEIEKMSAELSSLGREVRELEKRIRALDLVEKFGEAYLGKDGLVARELTRVVRSELERRANRVLSRLGLPPVRIGEGFEISVVLPTGEVPVKNASGGERVGISIALRLALAEIVMGRTPTTLILDEPTVYLDEDRRSQVFNIVRELGKSLKQVLVVTHDEGVVNVSEKVIAVENIGGISRVSER